MLLIPLKKASDDTGKFIASSNHLKGEEGDLNFQKKQIFQLCTSVVYSAWMLHFTASSLAGPTAFFN